MTVTIIKTTICWLIAAVVFYLTPFHTVTNPNNGLQATDTLFISSLLPTSAALYQQLKDAEINIQQQKKINFYFT